MVVQDLSPPNAAGSLPSLPTQILDQKTIDELPPAHPESTEFAFVSLKPGSSLSWAELQRQEHSSCPTDRWMLEVVQLQGHRIGSQNIPGWKVPMRIIESSSWLHVVPATNEIICLPCSSALSWHLFAVLCKGCIESGWILAVIWCRYASFLPGLCSAQASTFSLAFEINILIKMAFLQLASCSWGNGCELSTVTLFMREVLERDLRMKMSAKRVYAYAIGSVQLTSKLSCACREALLMIVFFNL